MNRFAKKLSVVFSFLAVLLSGNSQAFEFDGPKWFGASATYYVDMEGMSGTGVLWNTAFIAAMNEWNEHSLFNFSLVEENFDPCLSNGFSSVDFNEDFCGTEFGNNVLAVTVRRFEEQILGPPNINEADIVVNAAENFNVFDGDIIQFGISGLDFQRIALHELGHVIGLSHENQEEAIMAPVIGDIFELQADDIAGVKALYTGLDNCAVLPLQFGEISNGLNGGDCTVQDLTLGGTDNSFLDLYAFELDDSANLSFTASSAALDTVLILATTDLEYLDYDADTDNSCNSELQTNLGPGSYLLIVNTYSTVVKEDCNLVGDYQLFSQFSSSNQPQLGGTTSTQGTFNMASFSGGISADGGASFGNVFSSAQSLDISAEIQVAGSHVGQPGFLVVAALIEDQILMLSEEGEFLDVSSNPLPALRFRSKVLQSEESISIAEDLVPEALGIEEIEANIVVGYGLDSDPLDIFYHLVPLNLTVRPDA